MPKRKTPRPGKTPKRTSPAKKSAKQAEHKHKSGATAKKRAGAAGPGEKVITYLEAIVASPRPLTIPEIIAETGMTVATAHRLTKKLLDMGLIERDGERRHAEGSRLLDLSFAAIAAASQRDARRLVLRALADETGENCHFYVQDGSEIVSIAYSEGRQPLGIRLTPGLRLPLHCNAAGKLLLAHMPVAQREVMMACLSLTRYASRTITTVDELKEEIEGIQRRKFATAESESLEGVGGIAVPVFGPNARLLGALLVSSPLARRSAAELQSLLPKIREAAEKLGAMYRAP